MNREIKFRTWNPKFHFFEYWGFSQEIEFDNKPYFKGAPSGGGFVSDEIFKNTTQYIVAEDNQEIYEQDIIQEWKHDRLLRTFIAEDIRTFTREYDKSEHDSIWKVIGNKFENPELLEDK